MEKSYSESYAAAGVDITAGYRSVELMKQYVARTMNEHCIGGLGGFGGLFELDCTGYKHPVLISGTDGVGTKLKLAMLLNKHDTIGSLFISMQKGVSRGIFSNEAGLGTGSIAHACADTKKPVKQGMFGIFERLQHYQRQFWLHCFLISVLSDLQTEDLRFLH